VIGAGLHERTEFRTAPRNGFRSRTLTTIAGDLELRIPKLRAESFLPSLLERRQRIDQALFAVVMEAYLHGVSTRRVDDLLRALGADTGISKSEVSRICADLDEEVAAFRDRCWPTKSLRTCSSTRPTVMTLPLDPGSPKAEPTDRMREFLGRHVYLTLATHNADGSQHVVPVVYLFEDGRFLVATSTATKKARNLAAGPQVTVTVDDRSTIEFVSAVGMAELLAGTECRAVNHRLYRLWMTDPARSKAHLRPCPTSGLSGD
jgi:hypothetical protein